jgi:hypothetical protein
MEKRKYFSDIPPVLVVWWCTTSQTRAFTTDVYKWRETTAGSLLRNCGEETCSNYHAAIFKGELLQMLLLTA